MRQFMRLSRGSYFIFGAEKQLKKLVYFCEVFALQRKFALTRRRDLNYEAPEKPVIFLSICQNWHIKSLKT